MTKKKRMISLFIIITMTVVLFASNSIHADSIDYEDIRNAEDVFKIQEEACKAHEFLMKQIDPKDTCDFPDDFAGDFIEGDKLNVLLTGTNTKSYRKMLAGYDNVVFKKVKYSYKQLDGLVKQYDKEYGDRYSIIAYTVDIESNKGLIYVHEKDYDEVRKMIRDDRVIVEPSSDFIEQTTVIGGAGISANGYSFTLGGSGTYRGSNAFITCGHMLARNDTIRKGGNRIGVVTVNVHSAGHEGDYSIITAASGYSPTASVYTSKTGNTITYTGFWYHPGVGTYLYKFGTKTGQSYCRVKHYQITVNSINGFVGATIINGDAKEGDSGGPYRQGQNFCGVHRGASTSGNSTIVYFTPYSILHGAGFSIKTY